jgi:flagellar biosynthesis chaperone FliJ
MDTGELAVSTNTQLMQLSNHISHTQHTNIHISNWITATRHTYEHTVQTHKTVNIINNVEHHHWSVSDASGHTVKHV